MEYLPDVPFAAGERRTLLALLDLQRAAVTSICAGCSDEDLRARLVLSSTSILGIVKHLAYAERWWFQDNFAGREVGYPWTDTDPDAEFRISPDESTQAVLDFYAAECRTSRDIVAAAELDDRAARRAELSLRWIVGRMIWETARHAGQADILREQLDGVTGLGHTHPPTL
jgi:uncharacterized damage-inducible protein DinB